MSSDMSAVAARTVRMRTGARHGGRVGLLRGGLSVTSAREFSECRLVPSEGPGTGTNPDHRVAGSICATEPRDEHILLPGSALHWRE
jgi:hypothetical protein